MIREAGDSQELDGKQAYHHGGENSEERALGGEGGVRLEPELFEERCRYVDVHLLHTDGLDHLGELGSVDFVALARPDGQRRIVGQRAVEQALEGVKAVGGETGAHWVSYRLVGLARLQGLNHALDVLFGVAHGGCLVGFWC